MEKLPGTPSRDLNEFAEQEPMSAAVTPVTREPLAPVQPREPVVAERQSDEPKPDPFDELMALGDGDDGFAVPEKMVPSPLADELEADGTIPNVVRETTEQKAKSDREALNRSKASEPPQIGFMEETARAAKRGLLSLDQQYNAAASLSTSKEIERLDEVERKLAAGDRDFGGDEVMMGYAAVGADVRAKLRQRYVDAQTEAAKRIAERAPQIAAIPPSKDIEAALQAKSFGEFWSNFTKAPLRFITTVGVESLPQMAPGLILAAPATATAGPIGGAAAMGASSYLTDFTSQILGGLADEGVDINDPNAVNTAFSDPGLMARLKDRANKHATFVGAFDAASFGVASKMLLPAKTLAGRPVARELGNIAVQLPVQGALGAAGEATGSLASGQEIKPGELGAEFFGEFIGAPAEIAGARGSAAARQAADAAKASGRAPVPSTTPTAAPVAQPAPAQPAAPAAAQPVSRSSAEISEQQINARPVQSLAETENEVVTPDGSMAVPVETVIVELSDLAYASGDLQPRDRSRKESAEGVRYRAANLDPARLMPARSSDVGAPIVASDGTIVSGNGRVMSIAEVYRDPVLAARAEAYRAALGPEAEGMSQPVMVRRIKGDVPREDLVRFADFSNRPAIAEMSATERAQRDAKAATEQVMQLYQGGDFSRPENREFLRAFVASAVSPTERGSMARDGFLTKQGEDRLTAAVLASSYGDPDLLSRMLESTDDNIRNVSGAMRDAAGAILQLKQAIANGETDPQFDITPMIAEAAMRIADMRTRGIRPANALAQQDAFTQLDPVVESLIRGFYNEDLTRPVSRKTMTDILVFYAEEARKHSGQQGLIPDETTPQDVLTLSRDRVITREATADLFADGERLVGGDPAGLGAEGQQPQPDDRGPTVSQKVADVNTDEFSAKFKARKPKASPDQIAFFDELFGPAPQEASTDLERKFRDVLAGTEPRSQWASLVGATPEQMQQLEQSAVNDGLLRVAKNGQIRRTSKAKAAPAPVQSTAIEAQSVASVAEPEAASAQPLERIVAPERDIAPRDVRPGRIIDVQSMDPAKWNDLKRALKLAQPFGNVDGLLVSAGVRHEELLAAGREIAVATGAVFKGPKLKGRDRIEEKLNGQDARFITDAARGGFDVTSPEQSDAVVAELSKRFGIVDEGWIITEGGYFDRKIMVRFADGVVGEIQMWPPGLLDAKEVRGGHKLYEEWRRDGATAEEKDALQQQMRELYFPVVADLSAELQEFLVSKASPSLRETLGNWAASASRDISGASRSGAERIISLLAETQASVRSSTTAPEAEVIAGEPSQLKYLSADISSSPSTTNIVADQKKSNLSIPSEVRIARVISRREDETGRSINLVVSDYAYQLEELREDVAATEALIAQIAADPVVKKADALELAHLVGYPPKSKTTKAQALASIVERAKDFKSGQTIVDLFAPLEQINESPELRRAARPLPEGAVPEGVQGSGGERGTGSPDQGEAAGSGGDVRPVARADDERPQTAEGLSGEGGSPGTDPADRRRVREERDRVRALVEKAEQDRRDRSIRNYQITPDDEIGSGGAREKIRNNIEAIKVLRVLQDENRDATEAEKKVLVKYTGWGQFSQAIFDPASDTANAEKYKAERAELQNLMSAEEWAAAKKSTLNAHYTSEDVISGMYDALSYLGWKGDGRALEPSAGIGHFIGLQQENRDRTAWTAVELDSLTGAMTQKLYNGADVRVGGYEKQIFPNNFFDVAISNVPFGSYSVPDNNPAYKGLLIHDYFFVRTLDKVRPGGIVAFITSSGTLDKADAMARKEMARRADFLGAVRLPGGKDGAFQDNAGTDVTTDIIFLRKRGEGEQPLPVAESFLGTEQIQTPEGPTEINEYFVRHPEMMLGEMRLTGSRYRAGMPQLVGSSENLGPRILEAVQQTMPADVFVDGVAATADPLPEVDSATAGIKEGAFYEKGGKLYRKVVGVGQPVTAPAATAAKIRAFMRVRDIVNELLARQAKNQKDGLEQLRADLNAAYDSFVSKYGPINKTITTVQNRVTKTGENVVSRRYPNLSVFKADPDAYKVAALEIYDEKNDRAEKAAIFDQDVLEGFVETDAESPADALAISLNARGRVDMAYIANKLNVSEDEAAFMLRGAVFKDPEGNTWRTAAEYLSGDVVTKLANARAAAEADKTFVDNVAALEEIQPAPLTRVDIRVLFGAPWIDASIYEDFLRERVGAVGTVKVTYLPQAARWELTQSSFPASSETQWGTEDVPVRRVVEAALNNASITIKRKTRGPDGSETTYVDQKATEDVNSKIALMRAAFGGTREAPQDAWVWEDEARAESLETTYNAAFNRIVPEKHDGSFLTFPRLAKVISFGNGETGTIRLPAYRTGAIWRIISKGNALLAHAVGAGKTFTLIMSGMEQKRLGLIQRPMYVVPNHMLEQFSREFLQAYPDAKLLVADKDSMSKDNRREFAARVVSQKWDGVIITHDSFGRIGMSQEAVKDYVKSQLEELEAAIYRAKAADGGKSPTVKDLEKSKSNLEARLNKLINEKRKDEGMTFEELGVDFLYVDEAHLFKNLPFYSRHRRIKGIANTASQRAQDLFMKIQWLEKSKPGRSAVFATGTPVSNTMAELYTMQRYLQMPVLKEYGIDNFDAWASNFGDIVSQIELAPNGRTMREVRAFRRFVNIPELMTLYGQVADVQTAAMLNLPVPKLKGGTPTVVVAEPSRDEEIIMDSLVKRADAIKGKRPEKGADNMLKIMSEGMKLGTDIRLLNPDAAFNPEGKVGLAVERIFDIWKNGKSPALGQIVFLDMGVPGSETRAKAEEMDEFDDTDSDDTGKDDGEFDAENSILAGRFNLYQDIKDRLIAKGIPKEQIAFIHDAKDDVKKGRLFKDVKAGKVRILLGSTGKMGVGTNVQDLLTAMHHIDAPWRPADLQQRDGRILRQGNKNAEVQIFRYVTARTLDSYRWQTLESKSEFIAQLEAGARGVREAEDIDSPLPEAAAIKAAATDNPLILEHANLKKSIRELEAAKRGHERTIASARQKYQELLGREQTLEKSIGLMQNDVGLVTDLSGDNFSVDLAIFRDDQVLTLTDRKEAGEQIRDYMLRVSSRLWIGQTTEVDLGSISGFALKGEVTRQDATTTAGVIYIEGTQPYGKGVERFILTADTAPLGLVQRFTRLVQQVPSKVQAKQAELDKIKSDLPKLAKQAEMKPFPRQDELTQSLARSAEIEVLLDPEKQKKIKEAEERLAAEAAAQQAAQQPEQGGEDDALYALRTVLTQPGVFPAVLQSTDDDGLYALRAWHGSPHLFARFSLDFIGTGEGAQAYGFGLYFAESEDVARSYRDNLGGKDVRAYGEEIPFRLGSIPEDTLSMELHRTGDIDSAIEALQFAKGQYGFIPPEEFDAVIARAKKMKADNAVEAKPKGRMYEVNIKAKPEDFLDWDKPFSSADDVERFAARFDSVDPQLRKRLEDYAYYRQQAGQPMPDGNDIIREIMGGAGTLDARRASQVMREAGIPGIKYLDAGSRDKGDGTRNYVVFDDSLIEIVSIDGKPVKPEVSAQIRADLDQEAAAALGRAPLREEAREMLPEWADAVLEQARRLLPPDVAVRLADRILVNGLEMEGAYRPKARLLEIGLSQGLDRALELGRHEAVHVAREDGLYTDQEWTLLLERGAKVGIDKQIVAVNADDTALVPALPLYERLYRQQATKLGMTGAKADAYVAERLNQERVAKMHEAWSKGTSYGSKIDALLARLKYYVEAMLNAARGLGFQTADDVFERFMSGEIARRGDVQPEPQQARSFTDTPEGRAVLDGFGLAAIGADESQFALPTRRFGIPKDLQNTAFLFKSDAEIKAHPDYKSAKAGDREAAARLVDDLVTGSALEEAARRLGPNVVYLPVVAQEASGKNKIPQMLAERLSVVAGASTDIRVTQANATYHTGGRPLERLIARPVFDGDVTAGARYVLVDDVTVLGGTLAELANHVASNGGQLAGVITLVSASRTGLQEASLKHQRAVEERFGNEIRELFGVEPEALTADESTVLLGYRDADGLRAATAKARGERSQRLRSKGIREIPPEDGADISVVETQITPEAPEMGPSSFEARTFDAPNSENTSVTVREKDDGNRVRTYKVDGQGFVTCSESPDGTWAVTMVDGKTPADVAQILENVQIDLGQRLSPDGWLTQDAYNFWSGTEPQKVSTHVFGGPLLFNMWIPARSLDSAAEVMQAVALRSDDPDVASRAARRAQELKALRLQTPIVDDVLPALRNLPTPINIGTGNQPQDMSRPDQGLSDLVKGLNDSLGLITRTGRLNPGLKAAAARRGGMIAGQYSKRTGVTRLAIPMDLITLAHEGGHALEATARTKAKIGQIKVANAEELLLPPMPDAPPPQMPPAGFSGIEIDAETQALIVQAVSGQNAERAQNTLAHRLGRRISEAVIADVAANGGSTPAGYTARRYSASGQPSPRPQLSYSAQQLSEAWADWFAQYVTAPETARTLGPNVYEDLEAALDGIDPAMLEGLEQVQDGYRALVEASPVQAVRSRVQSTVRPGKIAELRARVAENGLTNTIRDWWYAFYSAAIDGKHPMNVAVKYLLTTAADNMGVQLGPKEILTLKAIDDPYKRWRLAEHSKVHATNLLQNGIRFAGNDVSTGPSFHEALKVAFGGTWKSQWSEEQAELFGSYLITRRMLAEFGRYDRKELDHEPDLLIRRGEWEAARISLEQKYPDFVRAADLVYEFSKNVLRWKYEEGFIDQKTFEELEQRVDYTPLNRIMDDNKAPSSLTSARGANKSKMIKRFMGSTRDFINPLESIVQDVYATQARVALNGVIRSMDKLARAAGPGGGAIAERIPAKDIKGTRVDLREAMRSAAKEAGLAQGDFDSIMEMIDDLFDQDAAANIFRATDTNEKGEPIVYLWEGGKRVPIRLGDDRIGKDIFDQFVAFGQSNSDFLIDSAALFTQALRAGVTKAPSYIAINFFRDQLSTWVLSETYTPFVTGAKGLVATIRDTEEAQRYQAFGGLMGGIETALTDATAGERDIQALRKKGFWSTPGQTVIGRTWNGFLRTMEITEAATRVGHFDAAFKRALADGMSREEAAWEAGYAAHDVMDFSRRGARMGTVSRLVAFLNASLQGLDALRRTVIGGRDTATAYRQLATPYIKGVTGSPLSVAEKRNIGNSTRAVLKMLSLGMIGFALAALYGDDDEAEEFNDYMRATHWFFKLGGTWWRYPKPFELAIISNGLEAAYDGIFKEDPRALDRFLNGLTHTMIPPHELQAVKFFYELKMGKDTFRDRDIVGMDIAGLPPELQYNAYTSEFGKMIGDVAGVSPAYVDHFMQSAFATVGRDVLTLSDYVLPRANQALDGIIPGVSITPRAEKSLEDQWFVSRFSRRAARGALSTEYFWKQMSETGGELAKAAAGYKKLYEAGRLDPRTSLEAKAFLDNLSDDQRAFAYLETHFEEKQQDLHPLNRARQVIGISSGLRKEMILGGIVKNATKKKSLDPESITLTTSQQRSVNEILEDIAMREARNGLIVAGVEGWAQKQIMPTSGLVDELRKVAPDVADEFDYRQRKGNKKVYSFDAVRELWPQVKERLLKEGPDAILADLTAEARAY